MIKVKNIRVHLNEQLEEKIIKKLNILNDDLISYKILKKSLDARKKNNIYYLYEVDVNIKNISKIKFNNDIIKYIPNNYSYKVTGNKLMNNRPVIVGSGPSGLFCAYMLSCEGFKPLIIEKGEDIDNRVKTVELFWKKGILNENSNVQFGEGGAGTFSDGKLNTLVKDKNFFQKKVFEIFVENGAPEEIMYVNNPHIGTDILKDVVKNIRNKIIKNGGEFRFNCSLTNIFYEKNRITSIQVNNKEIISCDNLILALGHSSRETFKMLYNNKINMTSKPFAIGIRIEHLQEVINKSQYGNNYKLLPVASYKLTYKSKSNRGIYSFCMCPGGYVVNASSEKFRLCVNGMSNYKRDSKNSNSAIVLTVDEKDYGNDIFAGVQFQRNLEELAYNEGNGNIPIQSLDDFYNNKTSKKLPILPSIKGKYTLSNINNIFSKNICDDLKEAIKYFGTKIDNFDKNAVICAVESRTSSPIRIIRNDRFMTNIYGVYPIGEGAGYAGGITTSAMDGIRIFDSIIKYYKGVKND